MPREQAQRNIPSALTLNPNTPSGRWQGIMRWQGVPRWQIDRNAACAGRRSDLTRPLHRRLHTQDQIQVKTSLFCPRALVTRDILAIALQSLEINEDNRHAIRKPCIPAISCKISKHTCFQSEVVGKHYLENMVDAFRKSPTGEHG